jgi:hypothetical protein
MATMKRDGDGHKMTVDHVVHLEKKKEKNKMGSRQRYNC